MSHAPDSEMSRQKGNTFTSGEEVSVPDWRILVLLVRYRSVQRFGRIFLMRNRRAPGPDNPVAVSTGDLTDRSQCPHGIFSIPKRHNDVSIIELATGQGYFFFFFLNQ